MIVIIHEQSSRGLTVFYLSISIPVKTAISIIGCRRRRIALRQNAPTQSCDSAVRAPDCV